MTPNIMSVSIPLSLATCVDREKKRPSAGRVTKRILRESLMRS